MRIIQFLNWDIKTITDYLDVVSRQNFDTIQINPVQPFIKMDQYEWWSTYQPLDFKIGNIYGSKEDLIILCKEAKKRRIKIVVDVITNHLANDGIGRETIPHRDINPDIRNNEDYWKKHSKVNDFKSYHDIIEGSAIGLPGLNLKNEDLQDKIFDFLEELKDCGVSGFRFDAAKHIGLPSDGVNYFQRVKDFLIKNGMFAYGEFLDGPNDISDEVTKTIYEKKSELAELMYILTEEDSLVKYPAKKIVFPESHDTYLNEDGTTKHKSTEEIIDKYVELTQKYRNTLFYVRDLSYGKKLFTKNTNRAGYADKTWMNSEKLSEANLLNIGNEYKNIEKITKEKEEIKRKERIKMEKDEKLMKLHHELSLKVHEILLNQLEDYSSVREYVNMAILDYNIQSILNSLLGVTPYDDFLINCITGEFYKQKWNTRTLNNVSYPEFSKQVLTTLKERIINHKVTDGLDKKIKNLSK